MKKMIVLALLASTSLALPALAQTPADFKNNRGVYSVPATVASAYTSTVAEPVKMEEPKKAVKKSKKKAKKSVKAKAAEVKEEVKEEGKDKK
jgi:hypothetical protein